MVEDVEELGAQLHGKYLADLGVLGKREVNVPIARAVNAISAQIAERAVERLLECERVKIAADRVPVRVNRIHCGHQVRTLIEIESEGIVVGVDDRDRPAALRTRNPVQLPTGTKRMRQRVPSGNLVTHGSRKAMPGIES